MIGAAYDAIAYNSMDRMKTKMIKKCGAISGSVSLLFVLFDMREETKNVLRCEVMPCQNPYNRSSLEEKDHPTYQVEKAK